MNKVLDVYKFGKLIERHAVACDDDESGNSTIETIKSTIKIDDVQFDVYGDADAEYAEKLKIKPEQKKTDAQIEWKTLKAEATNIDKLFAKVLGLD